MLGKHKYFKYIIPFLQLIDVQAATSTRIVMMDNVIATMVTLAVDCKEIVRKSR